MSVLVVDKASFPSLPEVPSCPVLYAGTMALRAEIGFTEDLYAHAVTRVRAGVLMVEPYFNTRMVVPELFGRDYICGFDRAAFAAALWAYLGRFPAVTRRERLRVDGLLRDDTGRVTGILGAEEGQPAELLHARLCVVGADGRHSLVARKVGARVIEDCSERTSTCHFADWEALAPSPVDSEPIVQIVTRCRGVSVLFFPSANGRVHVATHVRSDRADTGGDPQQYYRRHLDDFAAVRQRLAGARQVGELLGVKKIANRYREAGGPGWLLVGDAVHHKDPVDGQGVYDALIEGIMPSVNQNFSLIKDAIQTDPNYVYSYNNFRDDRSEGNKTSPIPSILEFINKRREDVKEQMVALNINCESQSIDLIAWNEVVINELVSSNTIESGIVDEKGESEDWIELYNNTNKDLNLDGYFMTDKKSDLTKWAYPSNTIIKANDYLIVWADENKNDGPLHTNFTLSKSGEQLYISDGVMYVDSLTFSSLDDNESYSRIPNGTGGFVKKNTTFGFDNTKISSVTSYNFDKIQVFPNPATDVLMIKHQNIITEISIYDIMGKILNTSSFINNNEAKVNISNLNPGIFFVEVNTNDYKTIKKFIKN